MPLKNYKNFLNKFLDNKYEFIFFNEFKEKSVNKIILRHDVDLDIDLALKMAEIENSLGLKSIYFFLLTNQSYNLISDSNIKKVTGIKKLGHQISLHFDLSIYDNPKKGFAMEKKIFNNVFNEDMYITSIHRPNSSFLANPENFFEISNTYEKKYIKKIAYFADSGGSFRFGNPLKSKEFLDNKNIQLCIHPIWWINSYENVNLTLENNLVKKSIENKVHFKKTIKSFI